MKKIQLTTQWMLSLIILLLFSSCEKKADDNLTNKNVLFGTWIDSVDFSPHAYYAYELIFDNNNLFTEKARQYDIDQDEDNYELIYWFVRTGNYELDSNNIGFIANKMISWDSFWGGDPDTIYETHVIFEDCTFKIYDDTLEINYITYPADAPENTVRKYKKQSN